MKSEKASSLDIIYLIPLPFLQYTLHLFLWVPFLRQYMADRMFLFFHRLYYHIHYKTDIPARTPLKIYWSSSIYSILMRMDAFLGISWNNGRPNGLIKAFSFNVNWQNMFLILFSTPAATIHHQKEWGFDPTHPIHAEMTSECSFSNCFICYSVSFYPHHNVTVKKTGLILQHHLFPIRLVNTYNYAISFIKGFFIKLL